MLEEFPQTVVLIDHLAEQKLGTPAEFAEVLALSRFPNVYMKLSGLNHFADDEPHYTSAIALTSLVIQTFGPDRLVWGSGSPTIVDVHMEAAGFGNDEDIAKVKGGNLDRLVDWQRHRMAANL